MTALLSEARIAPTPTRRGPNEVDLLVREHLPLVNYLVRDLLQRLPAHLGRDELVSAGMYALVVSAQGFDETRGVPFARYATIRIRGALTDELRSMDWASRAVRTRARELECVRTDLTHTLGRTPTREEIARAMGVTNRDVDAVAADVQRATVLSLQALTTDESDDILPSAGDGPEGLVLRREQLGYLHDAIAELPERLRAVVQGHFFEHRTMADIAAELGVTESRISQLRTEALGLLRAGLRAADGESPVDPAPACVKSARSAATRDAYCAAVAHRSTVSRRLDATNVLGEAHA
jgi:RNA polymerase sigma factor for flagellar operon FliA